MKTSSLPLQLLLLLHQLLLLLLSALALRPLCADDRRCALQELFFVFQLLGYLLTSGLGAFIPSLLFLYIAAAPKHPPNLRFSLISLDLL